MKPLLGIIGGLVASLAMFAMGLAVATIVLTPEPERQPGPSVDVADLWTVEPRRVDKAAVRKLERLPALPPPDDPKLTAAAPAQATDTNETAAPLDLVNTGSVQAAAGEEAGEGPASRSDQLSLAHLEWCANRYRSYRQEDDSYTSYAGEQLPCVSPYSKHLAASAEATPAFLEDDSYIVEGDPPIVEGDPSSVPWLEASGDVGAGAYAEPDHVSYCFNRYRSYRPEDNSYQPYGGGPRRQCR